MSQFEGSDAGWGVCEMACSTHQQQLSWHKTCKKGWRRVCNECMNGISSQREYSTWLTAQNEGEDEEEGNGGSSASTSKGKGKGKGYEEGWHDAINMIIDMLYEKGKGKGKGKSKGSEGNEDTDAKSKGKKRDGPY